MSLGLDTEGRAAPVRGSVLRQLTRVDPGFRHRIKVALLIALAIVNAYCVAVALFVERVRASDWRIMNRAAELAGSPELYELRGIDTFVWSPVAAYPLKLLEPLSFNAWQAVIILAALAMPTWRLRVLVLVSWPFWHDMIFGNLLTLIFLASVYAWRGSRIGTASFFALALLIPRPLLAPMGLWILWKRPEWRWPFVGMFVLHSLLVLWSGLGGEWISTLVHVGPEFRDLPNNLGPTRHIGYSWFLIGLPVGAWLFWRGRVGWAGLAISPYIWSYYLFWVLPEVNRAGSVTHDHAARTPASEAQSTLSTRSA